MSSRNDVETALRILRAKQQEYYVHWVKDAIEVESQRKNKLEKATSEEECRRLETQFEKQRAKDKERIHQIREDHELILNAKQAEWTAHGVPESALTGGQLTKPSQRENSRTTAVTMKSKPKATKMTKATMERLSIPVAKASLGPDTTQEIEFQKDSIRRQDRLRLSRIDHAKSDGLSVSTETDLLNRKVSLLRQLHQVVSQQERIIRDDQCTVRSAVSSWKSADFESVKDSS